MKLFRKCHKGYNSSVSMSDQKIDKIGKSSSTVLLTIHSQRRLHGAEFPWATILPKMHVMEDHTIPWLRNFHIGAGLMGEQGAESIHARMMKLERDFRGIKDELDSLKYIVSEQSLYTAPDLRPPVKRRKFADNPDSCSSDEEENGDEDASVTSQPVTPLPQPSILVFRPLDK
jgi:hypothetical protein